ncbi:GNAT family N-acetyltransferase [Luteipulveratus halotolerans]|uniref:GNAT family N-acetyltransferase n=1 Tax=Luteipulveratus halotolerans TaxID=1631356 RepID=UPI0018D099DF|nr:GNAT family protein [Luteipulveratus halotolerans]
MRLELLAPEHARPLERFELDNRAFFATRISDRGDGYFAHFDARLAELVEENRAGTSLIGVLLDPSEAVVGRVNITDIDQPERTEIGFRVAKNVQGQGIARTGVRLALDLAVARGVRTVHARVATDNPASRRVLEVCGFQPTGPAPTPEGSSRTFIGYIIRLDGGEESA